MRHYSSWDTEALRSWNFEGSNDGSRWTLIGRHVDDKSLNKTGQAFTWPVDCREFFSKFRILMTNINSDGHWVCLSNFCFDDP